MGPDAVLERSGCRVRGTLTSERLLNGSVAGSPALKCDGPLSPTQNSEEANKEDAGCTVKKP